MSRRDQPDHYSLRAQREGYRARSVYKLEELQRRFRLLRPGMRVLDVGAAPGSWSQYARRILGAGGTIVAVDLSELPALEGVEGVRTVVGDAFDQAIIERIAGWGPYQAILSDAAPRTTGNRGLDTARSAALVEHVVVLCDRLLEPGGSIVAKLFQGGDERALLQIVRDRFDTGRLIKPRASRDDSFEAFLVGTGFRETVSGDTDDQ